MLVEFQGSNNQVVSIATRHAFAVLQQLLRACCDRTCREREATYREQSDVIRIYFSVQVRFDEFLYLGVFNFCLEKMSNTLVSVTEVKIDPSDCCTCNESSCQVFLVLRCSFVTLIEEEGS